MSNDNNNQQPQPQPTAQVQSTPLPELPREPTNRIVKGNLSDDHDRPVPTSIIKKDR